VGPSLEFRPAADAPERTHNVFQPDVIPLKLNPKLLMFSDRKLGAANTAATAIVQELDRAGYNTFLDCDIARLPTVAHCAPAFVYKIAFCHIGARVHDTGYSVLSAQLNATSNSCN
jgi:hypothetical protein